MTAADEEIQDLTDRLGLTNERQDWGICNADAGRTSEFIRVCRAELLTPVQQYAMVELVLASMNEALADGVADKELLSEFRAFLTLNLHGIDPQLRYWSSLVDADEFPLAALLGKELATAP